jgi:hypothetical protein
MLPGSKCGSSISSLETTFERILRSISLARGTFTIAMTAQLKIAERFIGTELPKLVKTRTGGAAGQIVMAKTLELTIADAWMVVTCVSLSFQSKVLCCRLRSLFHWRRESCWRR